MPFVAAYHTDVGIKKKTNQDALLLKSYETPDGSIGLFIVCDGMGGLSHGELASATVIHGMNEWFESELPELIQTGVTDEILYEQLEAKITALNEKILQYGEASNIKLGTTITALLIVQSNYYIAQIGDSRAYHLQQNEASDGAGATSAQAASAGTATSEKQPTAATSRAGAPSIAQSTAPPLAPTTVLSATSTTVTQLTKDQTFVAREVERGNLTPQEAKTHPRRNVLLQCVGASDAIQVDLTSGQVEPGSLYVLCSDGFSNLLEPEEIGQQLEPGQLQTNSELKQQLVHLVETVKQRNETDNISALAVKIN
ncbi:MULTISPECIES: PP2C family protein-serine/threonine phosphatase [Bacillaceae]|uniref:Protein phosphatase 2C domain-containing protein n=1 Tax=Evansella alkalicola TaxID=745819 RepID=A0ABS6K083_9BACI|nr:MULTISPECIES: protein phosphatase 2C domain-containing protein [Bacillaceae]MBU9724262.1 protein phosphatase 2C domain-containing protein [Bacillus alkalicola]